MDNPGIKTAVLIVAGGSGNRMGSHIPKQFLPLAGKPVIVHSIERFRSVIPEAVIYLALGKEMFPTWEQISGKYGLTGLCRLCEGGETRFATVKNALASIEPCDLVLVHDAVRPLVTTQVIESVVRTTLEQGAAIPVTRPVDSFRVVDRSGASSPFDRSVLRAVQTPQGFHYSSLLKAYNQPYHESFTDDAQVMEAVGHAVALCEGSPLNIKLTCPEDMVIAQAILSCGKETLENM